MIFYLTEEEKAEASKRIRPFNRAELLHERVLQREKARRDAASRLAYTVKMNRAKGREEGLAEVALIFVQTITKLAQRNYDLLFTEADEENLRKIRDLELLASIMDAAFTKVNYEDFRRMF